MFESGPGAVAAEMADCVAIWEFVRAFRAGCAVCFAGNDVAADVGLLVGSVLFCDLFGTICCLDSRILNGETGAVHDPIAVNFVRTAVVRQFLGKCHAILLFECVGMGQAIGTDLNALTVAPFDDVPPERDVPAA